MRGLEVNPKNGYLESETDTFYSFTGAKKAQAIEMALGMVERGEMPRVTEICRVLGVHKETFTRHRREDPKFKAEWEDLIDRVEEKLVRVMVARGQTPGGYMDRITWLRAYRPGRWNPDRNIQVSHDISVSQKVMGSISGFIEAEIPSETAELPGNSADLAQLDTSSYDERPLGKGIEGKK